MEIETWTHKTEILNEWLENNPPANEDTEEAYEILQLMIRRGNKNPERIEKCWNVIRMELRHIEGHPLPSGRQSNLPPMVQQTLHEINTELANTYAEAFSNNDMVGLTHFRRVKGEVGTYDDANAFAAHKAKTVVANLKKYFNEGFWDGTIEGLANIEVVQNEE